MHAYIFILLDIAITFCHIFIFNGNISSLGCNEMMKLPLHSIFDQICTVYLHNFKMAAVQD